MQQRQLRLGDVLDDYCPRERRLTNHVVVAMVGPDVKQTRCTTCDAEHEYKHAKLPRQRRKPDTPAALYSQVLANGPKRVAHEPRPDARLEDAPDETSDVPEERLAGAETLDDPNYDAADEQGTPESPVTLAAADEESPSGSDDEDAERDDAAEEGPVHRPLIRATLPRQEGQAPPARPIPDFTVRQPGGRPNRFRMRHQQRGPFQGGGNRTGNVAGGPMRGAGGGRPGSGSARRHGPRKRSK